MNTTDVLRLMIASSVVLHAYYYGLSQATFSRDNNSSCVQAQPKVTLSSKKSSCIFYKDEGKSCQNVIGNQSIFDKFGDKLRHSKTLARSFERYIPFYPFSEGCKSIIADLYCRYLFPLCDTTLSTPYPRHICRKSCEFALHVICKDDLTRFKEIAQRDPDFDPNLINCSTYPVDGGGEAPECHQYHSLPGDDTRTTDCYYGIGIGYRGDVNITRSGRSCQPWSSQCPHRHWRFPEDVVDGQNGSNMCRNPDASAPDGPWCYTTDPKIRWEYCNISRCPLRVPKTPGFLKGYPLNSTSIYIFWKRIPPSSHNKQLLGYRIQYRRVGSQLYSELNITSNITETVISTLDFQTTYEIKVNGFNEIGHGPPGIILVVKTFQEGEILSDVKFVFLIDTTFESGLSNSSSNKFKTMEEKIRLSVIRQFNDSSLFTIYEVRVLRFSKGSVKADILVLAKVREHTMKAMVVTRLMDRFDRSFKTRLGISAVIVKEKPPPPVSPRVTNIQTRYFILTWDKPKFGGNYHIHSFIVELKKEGSDNFTPVKTLPYSQTGMVMENLHPGTEYTIKLSSSNKYGTSDDGTLLKQRTLPDRFMKNLLLTIVLPLGLAVLFIGFVCLKFRPTCPQPEKIICEKMVLGERGYWFELPRSAVEFKEKLGEGAFGEVFKGVVRISGQFKNCAVKKLKANATDAEKRDLRNELQIMATAGEHPNLVTLMGACTEEEPVLVVVSLAQNGCLLNHLQKLSREHRYINVAKPGCEINFDVNERVRIARDIANGMLHLSNKKCIHRDLAARNVLLDDKLVAMVSDFGLSRDVYESGAYENTTGGVLPVRWMALESLVDYTYSTKTDVWSFGVTLWEIESGGAKPYPGLAGMELVDFLKSGRRLKPPESCPNNILEMMMACWHPDPSQRPSFSEIVASLDQALQAIRVNLADGTTGSEFQIHTNLVLETDDLNNDDMSINLRDGITQYRPPVNTNMGSELDAEEENHKENNSEGSEDV